MKKSEFSKLIHEEVRKALKEMKVSEDGKEYIGKTIKEIFQDESSVRIVFADGTKMYINALDSRGGAGISIM